MELLFSVERRLAAARPASLLIALAGLSALRAGVWCIPNIIDLSALAQDPFHNFYSGEAEIVFENWLGPFLSWSVGLTTPLGFTLLHAGFSAVFLAVTCAGIARALPEADQAKAICVFAFLPVFWVPWYWIGYDSLTLALMATAVLLLDRPAAALLAGVPLGLQHHLQGAVAFGVLSAVLAPDLRAAGVGRRRAAGALSTVAGVEIGHQILRVVMRANHIHLEVGRDRWLMNHLDEVLAANLGLFPTFAYGLLGFGWVVLLRYLDGGSHRFRVALAVAACATVAGLTTDTTRVFSVISFPALCCLVIRDAAWLRALPLRHAAAMAALWLATPWLFRWGGAFRTTVLPYDVEVVLHAATGWPAIPPIGDPQLPILPFR